MITIRYGFVSHIFGGMNDIEVSKLSKLSMSIQCYHKISIKVSVGQSVGLADLNYKS